MAPAENSKRTAPGRPFKKGQSGNPGGRPKGLAALVRENTAEGDELVRFQLKIMRGESVGRTQHVNLVTGQAFEVDVKPSAKERQDAVKWLADRGWGQAVQSIDHTSNGEALSFRIERAK